VPKEKAQQETNSAQNIVNRTFLSSFFIWFVIDSLSPISADHYLLGRLAALVLGLLLPEPPTADSY